MGKEALVAADRIEASIVVVRGEKVLLDSDLATFYGVTTRALNQAVKRNEARFPADFMFRVTAAEAAVLNQSQTVTGSQKHRDPRYPPFAFTEQGIAMLSSVLRSVRAVAVNIEIMRAFVRVRKAIAASAELARRLDELERRVGAHDEQLVHVVRAIRQIMEPPPTVKRRRIGFHAESGPSPSSDAPRGRRR